MWLVEQYEPGFSGRIGPFIANALDRLNDTATPDWERPAWLAQLEEAVAFAELADSLMTGARDPEKTLVPEMDLNGRPPGGRAEQIHVRFDVLREQNWWGYYRVDSSRRHAVALWALYDPYGQKPSNLAAVLHRAQLSWLDAKRKPTG